MIKLLPGRQPCGIASVAMTKGPDPCVRIRNACALAVHVTRLARMRAYVAMLCSASQGAVVFACADLHRQDAACSEKLA